MTAEKQEVLRLIREGINLKFNFGVVEPEASIAFEFNSTHEMPIEYIQTFCGCTDAERTDHRIWGTLAIGSKERYHSSGNLYERESTYFTKQKQNGSDYFVPLTPGDMILATEENQEEFKAIKAAKEVKHITAYYDDGEKEFYVDEKGVRRINTEKIQVALTIEGWVKLS